MSGIAYRHNSSVSGINRILLLFFLFALLLFTPAVKIQAQNSSQFVEDKPVYHSSAWTLSEPLGSKVPSTIDTLLYNYQHQFIPALVSDAWAGTGSYAAPGINMIYFDRHPRSEFMFQDALYHYIPTFSKEKFYNVYVPMTLLSYNFAGGRENHTDDLKAVFADNVNKHWGFGANLDYQYTKGQYAYNAAKDLIYGLQAYYNGDKYEMQAFYNHYNAQNQENGGITNDLYISDPAQLQGGVTSIQPKSIPTLLTRAKNRLCGAEAYTSHAYKLGFYKDITTEEDSVPRFEFVPVTKFIYSFDYNYGHHQFTNVSATEAADYWQNTYFNPDETNDNQRYWSFTNTLGVAMTEGFHSWAKFGLSAYASLETNKYKMEVLEPQSDSQAESQSETTDSEPIVRKNINRLWVGGRLEKMKGSILRYAANAKFGLSGDAVGALDIDGELTTKFRLGKDSMSVSANGIFRNAVPSYFLQNYIGNHFIWHNDFGKIRSFRVGGKLYIPWTSTLLSVGVENIQNLIYFDAESMPRQHSGHIQLFTAQLDQKLKFGIWNWNNRITYQTTSNQDILPLPTLTVYSNMFLEFTAFSVLTMQIGVDCDYYTKYRGLDYQPATMQFHVQGDNAVDVGNFAYANAYITAKLSKTRFFILWNHVNQNLFSRNYFPLPHYPVNPRRIMFGISVDFAN